MPKGNGRAEQVTVTGTTGFWSYSAKSYDDFTAQEGGLEGFEQRYRQLSKGSFSGRIANLRVGDVCLSRELANRALENEFRFPEDMMCVAIPVGPRSGGSGSFGQMRPGGAVMPPAGRDNLFYMQENMDLLILSLPVEPDTCAGCDIQGATFSAWLCTVLDIVRNGFAREELMRLLPDLIRDHLSLLSEGKPRPGTSRRDGSVFDEILAACRSAMPEDLTVSGLSQRLGRSRAELRRACLSVTGLRLDDYLSAWRMNDVYRALRQLPGGTTVGRTALDFGYTHGGRFSVAFREMFGMCPRDVGRAQI